MCRMCGKGAVINTVLCKTCGHNKISDESVGKVHQCAAKEQ